MGPLAHYQRAVEDGSLSADQEQHDVMQKLDAIAVALANRGPFSAESTSFFKKLFKRTKTPIEKVDGLYLWGGVGRGKTHLCDMFFENVSFKDKTRLHFHHFMRRIHEDLTELGQVENPIPLVADKWASKARLLLLDEIHVNDITDAMLLGTLLTELFDRGVCLVTTSNIEPDNLYKDGLQRSRFLPAIEQIKKHTLVYEMCGTTDYRLRLLQKESTYLVGEYVQGVADDATLAAMKTHYSRLKVGADSTERMLTINQRDLPVIEKSTDLVWFHFDVLFKTARSTDDYIEIASTYHTVMISDIPIMNDDDNDAARRLVNLVDEFYDRNVKLIVSAAAAPDALYTGKKLEFEFVRAASRLTEMQTKAYLAAQVVALVASKS